MWKYICIALTALAITLGCNGRSPVTPHPLSPDQAGAQVSAATEDGPHRLWGEWTLFFNAERTQVDVVARRQGRFHLNATKILETSCGDCLQITHIHNNGDGTINLTVRIKHPFPGHPEFTGFDVKGIIMFNGSHYLNWASFDVWPYWDEFVISWRETGDPEVLNPDGYTPRWSPSWDSGSSAPIFSYWPGKYSNGTPTANVNAFLCPGIRPGELWTSQPRIATSAVSECRGTRELGLKVGVYSIPSYGPLSVTFGWPWKL
jgi:hypothetical protein